MAQASRAIGIARAAFFPNVSSGPAAALKMPALT